jgi:hypothetical protein
MTKAAHIPFEDLQPKFQDQDQRYNDWYFTVHFNHEGQNCIAKLAITEGTLLGQGNQIWLGREDPQFVDGGDTQVLVSPAQEIALQDHQSPFQARVKADQVVVTVGDLTAICTPKERRIISRNEKLGADLLFTARGPAFYWGNQRGGLCPVTENTRVAGVESLSDVKGTLLFEGETIEIEGRGLFEHVWFEKLGFFEIRVMNWLYANFDQLYLYLCHCESDASDGRPFHFETGDVYLMLDGEMLIANRFEFQPQVWAFAQEPRRFIPVEQTVRVETDKGVLNLNLTLSNYLQLIQLRRLEGVTMKNIPGWGVLFYDAPVTIEGTFEYQDGKKVELTNGRGINELIRLSPL